MSHPDHELLGHIAGETVACGRGPMGMLTRTLAEVSAHRPLAYSTLADLVHHVRQHLPLSDLSLAVQLFAKNIDDESLPSSIQTMSCKLLLNLVDCIRSKSEQESGNGRDVLMRMLEVPVLLGGVNNLLSLIPPTAKLVQVLC